MWYVYILKCSDQTFYTGITNNLVNRINDHNTSKKGAKYTKARRPVELIFSREFPDRSTATKEEIRIKKLTRDQKMRLINS